MSDSIPDKNYFRIGEVSKILDVEPYVVRYWESEFTTVKPLRTKSDQRLYRKRDVDELVTIRNLLYRDKFTIAGARKKLAQMKRDTSHLQDDHYRKLIRVKQGLQEVRKLLE